MTQWRRIKRLERKLARHISKATKHKLLGQEVPFWLRLRIPVEQIRLDKMKGKE
jgi:hypothetical protein